MNHANLATSAKMQQILALLKERGSQGITSMELAQRLNLLAVATEVSALRHNGIDIICRYQGESENRRRIYRYWLAEFAPAREKTA